MFFNFATQTEITKRADQKYKNLTKMLSDVVQSAVRK